MYLRQWDSENPNVICFKKKKIKGDECNQQWETTTGGLEESLWIQTMWN